jgi:DNA polymerase III delta prime subunit
MPLHATVAGASIAMANERDQFPQRDQPDVTIQQSGGVSLGAFNTVDLAGDLVGGDKVLGDKHVHYYPATSPRPPDRNRQAMLEKVRLIWIEGLLERSLDREARIELNIEERPDAVVLPLNEQVQELNRPARPLPIDEPIIDIFTQTGGALLIMGAPGAGKTTLLLELARDLVGRAMRDEHHPIPVVFNLSSWAKKSLPLAAWLVEELHAKYMVPPKIGRVWVESDALLPLLDGLDEVRQEEGAACVATINAYRREHGLLPMTVCTRIADYEALQVKLCLQSAIVVQPPTEAQVEAYLNAAGDSLAGLRAAWARDRELRGLAATPLLMSVTVLAYQGVSVEMLPSAMLPEEQRRHLFEIYVERMLARRSADPSYSGERTLRWLSWLARQMIAHEQSIFLLEQLEPALLASRRSRLLYYAAVRGVAALVLLSVCTLAGTIAGIVSPISTALAGMVLGLMIGLVMALALVAASVLVRWLPKLWSAVLVVVASAIVVRVAAPGLSEDTVSGAVLAALILSLPGSLAGLSVGGTGPIQLADPVSWAWPQLRRGFGLGLIAALVLAVVFALVANVTSGLTLGLLVGVGCLLPAILFGMIKRDAIEASAVPNQGEHRSLRRAAIIFGLLSLISMLVGVGWGVLARQDIGKGLAFGLIVGLPMAVVAALAAGGAVGIQHYLLRAILAVNGVIPWRYRRFLDYATERVFLRRIGGSYIFYHRLLMEYFANKGDKP